NALGVIYVGHGSNGDFSSEGAYSATAIDVQGTNGFIDMSELKSKGNAKANFVGIFGCGTVNVAKSIPGVSHVVAMDGGQDGETSLYGIGWAGFAAAKALAGRQGINTIVG